MNTQKKQPGNDMAENQLLEQAANRLKRENTKENLETLVRLLEQSNVYVPAALPPDTDPALIRQIIADAGQEKKIPAGVSPRPAVLENKDGRRFLPVFTTEAQAMKQNQRFPLILTMAFTACLDLTAADASIQGVVLNAFDQNIPLNVNKNQPSGQKKQVNLTQDQAHAVLRQHMEAQLLPEALFAQKKALVERLQTDGAGELLKRYQEIYPKELACPYTQEDFDVLAIHVRDDLTVLRITMPAAHRTPGTCPLVLLRWNPQTESLRYFGIVLGEPGEPAAMMEAREDGTRERLGEAPQEGSELQYMIDL